MENTVSDWKNPETEQVGKWDLKEPSLPSRVLDIKDSGTRQTFETGSVRDAQRGKGALHLVPSWVIWLVSRIYEDGAVKYSARNWEKGQPLGQYIKSAENHIAKLKSGMRDEPHASQAIWNLIAYIFTGLKIKMGLLPGSLNDMPDQWSTNTGKTAEPLSDMEYASMENFLGQKLVPEEVPKYVGAKV